MKKIFNIAATALFTLLCIFIVSISIPLMFSITIACITPVTLIGCTTSSTFWIVTILSILVTSICFYEESNK